MLSIGEFSKICTVTTRTLRHYDAINLIKPKHINPENGYRFYDVSQIRQMLLITRLKNYNFSLEEIAVLLSTDNTEYFIQQITVKKAEIHVQMKQYQTIEEQLDFDLKNLKRGGAIMSFMDDIKISLVETKPQYIFSSRQHMKLSNFCKHMEALVEKAQAVKLSFIGAPMAIYHDKEFDPENNDTEIGFPVAAGNETRILEGGLCVTAVWQGAYSNLPNMYAKLVEWIQENQYAIIAAPYEQYMNGPQNVATEAELITNIYFPVKKL